MSADRTPERLVTRPVGAGGWAVCLAGIVAVALPLALLAAPDATFTYDWHNHEWMVGYFGEYFRQHGRMPEVLNVPDAVGMPQPVFYGVLLYQILGLLSSMTGAAAALRVGAAIALGAQFAGAYLAVYRATGKRLLGVIVASAMTGSVYGLTNLYNRSALTEFFAVAFLVAGVGFGLASFAGGAAARRMAWLGGLLLSLAIGSHPPTALLGGVFVAILALAVLPSAWNSAEGRQMAWTYLAVGAVVAMISAPWLYAVVTFRGALGIVGKYPTLHVAVDRCDSLAARFAPFPYDPLPAAQRQVDLPYIEAPLSWALIVVCVWLAWQCRRPETTLASDRSPVTRAARRLAVAAFAWFVVTTAVSISPTLAKYSHLGPYVQFATRLVSHADLALLVLIFSLGLIARNRMPGGPKRGGAVIVCGIATVIALTSVGMKLQHGATVLHHTLNPATAWRGDRADLVLRGRADAAADYATIRRLPHLRRDVATAAPRATLEVGASGKVFGVATPAIIDVTAPGWVVTNIVAFPWNRVLVDGRDITGSCRVAENCRFAFRSAPGKYTLQWQWRGPRVWAFLRILSALAGLLGVALAVWQDRPSFRRQ